MFIPLAVLLVGGIVVAALLAWLAMLLSGRNPLPFPDGGSRIFSAASPEAKAAVVDLLAMHGVRERFQANTKGVLRSIMWDGTIVNYPDPEVARLGMPGASIDWSPGDPDGDGRNDYSGVSEARIVRHVVLGR
jgi:hypothetical protein